MHTQVLIAGAGPTGLMLACQLRAMGISCIILDPKEGPTVESRALVVQARTLEIYEQMGIAQEAISNGAITTKVRLITQKGIIATVPFTNIGSGLSQFPHVLVYEQNKNEQLLYKYLKAHDGEVHWQHELISFTQDADRVTAQVKDPTGNLQTITANYLVAADGAKSIVRHNLNLSFEGETYEHIFYVADTAIPVTDTTWNHEALNLYFSNTTFFALFPTQGERRFRAIGALPESFQDEHPTSFSQISPLIQSSVQSPVHFQDTSWFSVYRLHHRRIDQFRVGRIFLAGDAAHIHSPAGGQGMNTGLQDSYNLAWKLAFVLKGHTKDRILESYQQERLPIAKSLMVTTDRAFTIMTAKKRWPIFMRTKVIPYVVPVALKLTAFRRFIFSNISQIRIQYPNSLLTTSSSLNKQLRPGTRFPYIPLANGMTVYDKMKEMKFHLLVIAGANAASGIASTYSKYSSDFLETIIIEEKEVIAALEIMSPTLVLVRPDHYISCTTPASNGYIIEQFLLSLSQS